MDDIEKLKLLTDLENEHCELNHGPGTKAADFPAVDYIVLPFGISRKSAHEDSLRELVIPVCQECAEALSGDEWTLLFCFECSATRWVYREKAKNRYRHHILWLRGCPDCSNKFGGLYFNDEPSREEKVLLSKETVEEAA